SSEGSLTVQTVKTIFPCFSFQYRNALTVLPKYNRTVQGGWERMAQQSDTAVHDLVRVAMDDMDRQLAQPPLPVKPAEIGRYDIIYSADAMAALLDATLVPA